MRWYTKVAQQKPNYKIKEKNKQKIYRVKYIEYLIYSK